MPLAGLHGLSALILPTQYIPEAIRNTEGVSILGMLFTMECFCKLFSYSQLKFKQRGISCLFVFFLETEIMAKMLKKQKSG